jgi:hypothetical protein
MKTIRGPIGADAFAICFAIRAARERAKRQGRSAATPSS